MEKNQFNHHLFNNRSTVKPRVPFFINAEYEDNEAILHFGILGVDKSKLYLKYVDHMLSIRVVDGNYLFDFDFQPKLHLLWRYGADENKITAAFEHGVLSVAFSPKDNKQTTKIIDIQ